MMGAHSIRGRAKKISNRKRKQKGAYGEKARELSVVVNVQQKEDVEYLTNKSIYCLEPYKTLYLSYEGAAYPCCFPKSPDRGISAPEGCQYPLISAWLNCRQR